MLGLVKNVKRNLDSIKNGYFRRSQGLEVSLHVGNFPVFHFRVQSSIDDVTGYT